MKRTIAVALACLLAVPSIITASPATFAQTRQSARSSSGAAPVFAFPVNGTAYPSNAPYVFQVQPVSDATGYLWSFVQGGVIVYQNLAWHGHLSPAGYTVSTESKAHSLIHSGDLHVWVRALMKNGTWSATGAVMVRIQSKGGPHAKPTATPQPNATATPAPPAPGTVLYQADTAGGLDKWVGSSDWKHVDGMLIDDGSNDSSLIYAPYQPGRISDYAIEAEIQLPSTAQCRGAFGLVARESNGDGYSAGFDCSTQAHIWSGNVDEHDGGLSIADQQFSPDTGFHTYRVEVQGNTIKLLVDGTLLISAIDNRFLASGRVGLFTELAQINVRSFKVIAL